MVGRSTLRAGDTTAGRLVLRDPGPGTLRFTASPTCVMSFEVRIASWTIASPLGSMRRCAAPVPFTIAPDDSLVRGFP